MGDGEERDELLAYAASVEREPGRPEFGLAPPRGFELQDPPEQASTAEIIELPDEDEVFRLPDGREVRRPDPDLAKSVEIVEE